MNRLIDDFKDSASNKKQIMGDEKIDKKICKFQVDTGATRTTITHNFFNRNERNHIMSSDVNVITADGTEIELIGKKSWKIQIGDKICITEILVTKEMN